MSPPATRWLVLAVVIALLAQPAAPSPPTRAANRAVSGTRPAWPTPTPATASPSTWRCRPRRSPCSPNWPASSTAATERELDDRCVFVRPQRKASGGAMQALAAGWDEAAEGPRPVVWSPAASTWGPVLNERLSDAG